MTRAKNIADNIANWFDIDSWPDFLHDFIREAQKDNPQYKNPNTEKAIAILLGSILDEAKSGNSWNDFKKPLGYKKLSGVLNPIDNWHENARAQGIVMQYIAGFIDEEEAINQIKKLAPIKKRQIQNFIKKHRKNIYEKLKGADKLNGKTIDKSKLRPPD